MSLTKPQRAVLEAMPDWSARWEIQERLCAASYAGWAPVLYRLVNKGLAEYNHQNHTYRMSPLARASLTPRGEGDCK